MDSFYKTVLEKLNEGHVKYLIVGGFAVNFHGYNRSTSDLGIWIDIESSNLKRLAKAVEILGFEFGKEAEESLMRQEMISFSEAENIVEFMPRMNIRAETSFEMAYARSDQRSIDGLIYSIISLSDLINEKSKSMRYKDLDDLSKLEAAAAFYQRKSKEE